MMPATEVPGQSVYTLSEEETQELGRTIARTLIGGEFLILIGELGTGKTVFVRGLAEGLGAAPEEVSSPSFVLCREYEGGRVPFFHLDLYRLEPGADLGDLALDDLCALDGVVAVEWGERLPARFRRSAIEIRFQDLGEETRRIDVRDRRAVRPRAQETEGRDG
jgi:tRNA threonylcarbamoyladenosine biosynthesis protein TsaE